jgi:hypothetical protein
MRQDTPDRLDNNSAGPGGVRKFDRMRGTADFQANGLYAPHTCAAFEIELLLQSVEVTTNGSML